MKLTSRQLAAKAEQLLAQHVPMHTVQVTHSPNHGVRIEIIFGGKLHSYKAGKSWTTIDMTIQQIARDYIAARFPKEAAE